MGEGSEAYQGRTEGGIRRWILWEDFKEAMAQSFACLFLVAVIVLFFEVVMWRVSEAITRGINQSKLCQKGPAQ